MFAARNAMRMSKSIVRTYATWNPSDKGAGVVLSGGSLSATYAAIGSVRSSIGRTSGKPSWRVTDVISPSGSSIGVANASADLSGVFSDTANGIGYTANGYIIKNGSILSTVSGRTINDITTIAIDFFVPSVSFFLNGVLQYTATGANVPAGALYASVGSYGAGGASHLANFGAISFTPPSGYEAGLYL